MSESNDAKTEDAEAEDAETTDASDDETVEYSDETLADHTEGAGTENATDDTPENDDEKRMSTDETFDAELRTNLYRGALVLFTLLAVVAVIQLYGSVNTAIDIFIAEQYRPLFRAAFNLVVLLLAGIGISWTVRELGGQ